MSTRSTSVFYQLRPQTWKNGNWSAPRCSAIVMEHWRLGVWFARGTTGELKTTGDKNKRSSRRRRGSSVESLGVEAWAPLYSADYRLSRGNLWVSHVGYLFFLTSLDRVGSLVTCLGNVAPQTMSKTTGGATALTQPARTLQHISTLQTTNSLSLTYTNVGHFSTLLPGSRGRTRSQTPEYAQAEPGECAVESLITRASLWSNQVCPGVNREPCSWAEMGLPGLYVTSDGRTDEIEAVAS